MNQIFSRLTLLRNSEPVRGSILHQVEQLGSWERALTCLFWAFLLVRHSPGDMQSYIKSLLWTRHRRRIGGTDGTSPASSVSPNSGLKAWKHSPEQQHHQTQRRSSPLRTSWRFQWGPCSWGVRAQGFQCKQHGAISSILLVSLDFGNKSAAKRGFWWSYGTSVLDSNCSWYGFSVM